MEKGVLVRLSVGKQRTSGVWWGGGAASLNLGDLIGIVIFRCHLIIESNIRSQVIRIRRKVDDLKSILVVMLERRVVQK